MLYGDEEERRYEISVEAEDSFVFYVKTDKSPEEIVSLLKTIPSDESWLDTEYIEAEKHKDWVIVYTGLTESLAFTAYFRDGDEWYDSEAGKSFGRKDIEYFDIGDVGDIVKTLKKALGDNISDLKLSSDPMDRGLTICLSDDNGACSSYPISMTARLKKSFENFKKDFLKTGDLDVYLDKEKEQELIREAEKEDEKE